MKRRGEASWRQLLTVCAKVGKDKVLRSLEAQHKALENLSAHLWSDPATYEDARRLDRTLLKQDETLLRLRQMSDEEIRSLVADPPRKEVT